MPNTYTQIHIQVVFAVKYRQTLIKKAWKDELYKYITGIVQNQGHKMLAINGVDDHIHIFFGMRPNQSLSDLMRMVKGDSSKWINLQKYNTRSFAWQSGYGAFSYGRSQISRVIDYIDNQERHHRKKSFKEEYIELLKAFQIDFEDNYLFSDPT